MALLFASKALADPAVATINDAMGLHASGDVTIRWDVPKQDANGKWVVTKPEDRFMAGVTNYTEGNPVWPAAPVMGV